MAHQWMSPAEIAEEVNMSPKTIRRMAARGDFPADAVMKIGAHIRINREAAIASFFAAAQA